MSFILLRITDSKTDNFSKSIIEMLFKSIETTTIRIVGHGYTDYWATPRDPFVVDLSLKFNGLEEFCDDEILQDDYDELFKNR